MARSPLIETQSWRRWVRLTLALSCLLHLLFLLLVDLVYNPFAPPETGYRVLLQPPTSFSFSEPFPSLAPSRLPIPTFSPDGVAGPGQTPSMGMADQPEGEDAGPGAIGVEGLLVGGGGQGEVAGEKVGAFTAPAVPDLDYDRLLIEKLRQEIAEREQYARFHVLDADTTDDKSQRRSRARQIVERAIAAMGGREALGRVRELKARVWIEATENCIPLIWPPPAVQPYAYPVALWQYTSQGTFVNQRVGVTVSFDPDVPNTIALVRDPCITLPKYYSLFESRWLGMSPPVQPPVGKQREQGEAARWHFIDHFLGEGVEIYYLTSEEYRNPYPRHEKDLEDRGKGRLVDVVQVVDERYGHLQEALFDRETGLPLALREGLAPEEQRWYMMLYAQKPPVWMTLYGNYQPVQGVLTPHRLLRSVQGKFLTVHLKVAYNGEEPDRSEPDVSQ